LNLNFDQNNLDLSLEELEKKFKPYSDVRASNKYRSEISKNLLRKFFNDVQSELAHGK
jgi:xanthine dehydrogenase iron-sulfur cluster and FAD-binding subunit A